MRRDMAAYSNDEAEALSLCVSNYHLEDEKEMPLSFSVLPVQWGDSENSDDGNKEQVFLDGLADNGLQKIFMQVTAWRFDLSNAKPEISLLSKDRKWIKLQRPRKSFRDTVRTILVTIHFLHRVKLNPQTSAKSVWDDLCKNKELSSYGFTPSQNDILDHMPLIGEAAKRDAALSKSKFLLLVLEEKLGIQKLSNEEVKDLTQLQCIVDDNDNDMIDEPNEESEAQDDLFDSDMIDEPNEESEAQDDLIDSDMIDEPNVESEAQDDLFDSVCSLCDNGGKLLCCDGACMRSFHATEEDGRDSICDSLGFTRKELNGIQSFYCKNCKYNQHQCFACGKLGSSDKVKGAEVTKCSSATCGRFYHPHCVEKLLPWVVKFKHVGEELEKNIADGDPFICPVHYCCVCKELENKMEPELQMAVCRRCPKSYHRKCLPREIAFDDEDILPRAWEGLLSNNRILIYCLNHEIDDELGTPKRDHLKFPRVKAIVREINAADVRTKPAYKERVTLKNNVGKDKGPELTGRLSFGELGRKKKPKSNEMNKGYERIKPVNQVDNETLLVKPIRKLSCSLPPSDADSEKRNHDIADELGTPKRDHLKFPNVKATVPEINAADERTKPMDKGRVISKKNNVGKDKGPELTGRPSFGELGRKNKPKSNEMNKGYERIKPVNQVDNETLLVKPIRKLSRSLPPSGADSEKRNHEIADELGTPKRDHLKSPNVKGTVPKINAADERTKPGDKGRFILKKNNVGKDKGPNLTGRLSSGELSRKNKPKSNEMNKGYERIKPVNQVDNETLLVEPISCSLPLLDADSEKSLLALFKEARSSVTLESVKRKLASTHTHSFRNDLEKTITMGKLEGSVDAVRTALRKLESECSIQDVEAVCDPDVLNQIFMCKIIDKLHWYVQNGDTIVDFCCGANDFSILMKKKLEETGKKCSYRNYDLLPTKNGFSFERRDWMTIQPTELPTGSQLIMCLENPFGVKADLAIKFIDKALEFKPKLLILIVPPETERLEKRLPRYDLVWEDKNFLLGMSSYLPGSDDVNDGQLDLRNGRPPPFSLWSHPDWTTRHKVIAREHGHMSSQVLQRENFNTEMLPADHTMDRNNGNNLMLNYDLLKSTNDQEVQASINKGQKRSSHHGNVNQESQQGKKCRMSKSDKTSRKRKHIRENDTRGQGVVSPAKRQAVNEMTEAVPDHSQPISIDERFAVEGFQPKSDMACPQVEVGDDSNWLEPVSDVGKTNSGIEKWPIVASPLSDYGIPNNRSGTFERSVTQPGHHYVLPGFASGPHVEYSLRHSAGWLEE